MPNKIDDNFFHKQIQRLEKERQTLANHLNALSQEKKEILKKAPNFTDEDEIRLNDLIPH